VPKIYLASPQPLHVGPQREEVRPWGGGTSTSFSSARQDLPTGQLDRVASYAQTALGGATSDQGQISTARWYRLLTPYQIDLIYQRCPDVRASIDQIVRQVATHAWDVVPTIKMHDPQYKAALEACLPIKRWLKKPTSDGFTWQEVMTSFLTDLMKHDAAAVERVRDRKGRLSEAVPIRGPDIHPIQDARGRLDHYVQVPYTPTMSDFATTGSTTRLETDQVLYMQMFPSTISAEGQPLLEALVNEVIALLRAADYWARSVDANEIPPGILVLIGIAKDAAERMKAEYESKASSDWKIRMVTSPRAGEVDAKWVRLDRDPKELQIAELCDDIRRTVWRVFGVMPVEQGATEGMPRATAQVQLDASSSHLIEPILELLAAKINMLLVTELVDPAYLDLVEFRWVVHKELSPEERLQVAQAQDYKIKNGSMTLNEARQEDGRDPYAENLEGETGGDVPLVLDGKGGYVPLSMILAKPERQAAADQQAADAAAAAAEGGGGSGGGSGDGTPEGGDAPGDTGGKKAAQEGRPLTILGPAQAGVRHAMGLPEFRGGLSDAPPPGWLREDVRAALTADLPGLWSEMRGYWADVDQLWERAKAGVLDAVAAEQTLDEHARARIGGAISQEVTQLAVDWALTTRPRYRAVAEASRRRVGDWAGVSDPADAIRAQADAFHVAAMGYLGAENGLLTDVSREVMRVLTEEFDGATRAIPGGTSITGALTAVSRAWDAARYRIGNWVGRLIGLANAVLSQQALSAAAGFNPADPLWCEWADVGPPGECQSCIDLGSKGWIELATMGGQVPGDGATECRSNCRCVLRVFRRSEIDNGTAKFTGNGNTSPPPSP
jgi:hypothetical protein